MTKKTTPPAPPRKYTTDHKLIASFGIVRGEMVDVRKIGDKYVALHLKDGNKRGVGMFDDSVRATEFAARFAAHEIEVHRSSSSIRGHRT